MKFRWLIGDVNYLDYGGKWISNRRNNGDWDYWLVIELDNLAHIGWDRRDIKKNGKYVVTLAAVSPTAAEKELGKAAKSAGVDPTTITNDLMKVEILHEYGTYALLGEWRGKNAKKLLTKAREEAQASEIFFGFMMDRPQNMMSATGWDFIGGHVFPSGEDDK